jgi:hypothetical protein
MLIGVDLRFAQAKLNRKLGGIGIGFDVLCLGGVNCNIRSKIDAVSSPVRTEHHSCDAPWLLRFLNTIPTGGGQTRWNVHTQLHNYCEGD